MRMAGAATRTTESACAHDLSNARATWARQGEVATSFLRRYLDWRGLVSRHPFWCRDLAEDRTEEVLSRDMKIHVATWGEPFEVATSI